MKCLVLPVVCLFLAAPGLLSTVRAAPSAVTIRVEQANKSETEKSKKTQKRSLNVFVTNSSQEALELKVKYSVFGRDLATREVVTVDQGERPASVKPKATEKIETLPATAVSEDEHYDKKKKVEASGNKIIGHGVQVLNGDKVVAEAYDPPSMKEQWGKAAPVAKPDVKK